MAIVILLSFSFDKSIAEKNIITKNGRITASVNPKAVYVVNAVNTSSGVIYAVAKKLTLIAIKNCRKLLSGNLAKWNALNMNKVKIIQNRYLAILTSKFPLPQFVNKSPTMLCPVIVFGICSEGWETLTKLRRNAKTKTAIMPIAKYFLL